MSETLRVLLVGARGRMGRAIVQAAASQSGVAIAAECNRGDNIRNRMEDCEVVIDFSQPDGTAANCAGCAEVGKPLVLGTTGHSAEQIEQIRGAASSIPIVVAPNFSVGVNTLFWLTRKASELLGDGFDIEIVEMHHRLKKDAPSGTAKRLAEVAGESRGLDAQRDLAHGRAGFTGARPVRQIGMHAIRAGDIVGEHTVIFAASGERVELTHKASSRETFAVGALRAARWVVGQAPGIYSMEDVLGLNDRAR